jgi:hypothetical protein
MVELGSAGHGSAAGNPGRRRCRTGIGGKVWVVRLLIDGHSLVHGNDWEREPWAVDLGMDG